MTAVWHLIEAKVITSLFMELEYFSTVDMFGRSCYREKCYLELI